ncbi:putative DEAD/DEAH box helicase [Neospora caninum Liverpool]|uniref:Putative DEAD/DEAH box helicase n=1 Tax=Neospora caninum (strain Liverpool) TaxID=572307 RepID=F0VGM6_NEOCL|nr:putative DEAD/DEAH box helicase [Neospora caninum Liverpool]CBZ52870.1 putative DEAD/DEAH box helicase [Neospora caninum Liverpool]|eukprot:XP_003882902.1 putative DEAD/DEAH box helicase [Neospora caninum Liverpool]
MAGFQLLGLLFAVLCCGASAAARVVLHVGSHASALRQPAVHFDAPSSFTAPALGSALSMRENLHFAFGPRIPESAAAKADPHAFVARGQKHLWRSSHHALAESWLSSFSAPSSGPPSLQLASAFLRCLQHPRATSFLQVQKNAFPASGGSARRTTIPSQRDTLVTLSLFFRLSFCRNAPYSPLKFGSHVYAHPAFLVRSGALPFSPFSAFSILSRFQRSNTIGALRMRTENLRIACSHLHTRFPVWKADRHRTADCFPPFRDEGRGRIHGRNNCNLRRYAGVFGESEVNPTGAEGRRSCPGIAEVPQNDANDARAGYEQASGAVHPGSGGEGNGSAGSDSPYCSRVDHRHGYSEPVTGESGCGDKTGGDDESTPCGLESPGDADEGNVDAAFLLKKAEELPREEIEGLIQHLRENLPHLIEPVHAQFVEEIHRRLTSREDADETSSPGSAPRSAVSFSAGEESEEWRGTEDGMTKDTASSMEEGNDSQEDDAGHSEVAADGDEHYEQESPPEAQISDSLFDDLSIYSAEELHLILRLLLREAEKVDRAEASGTSVGRPAEPRLPPAPRRDLSTPPWETEEEDEEEDTGPSGASVPLAELLATRESIGDVTAIPRYKLIEILEKLSPFIAALPFDDFLNAPSAFTTEQLRDVVGLALARMQQGIYSARDPMVVRRIGKWRARREKYAAFRRKEIASEKQETGTTGEEGRCGVELSGVRTVETPAQIGNVSEVRKGGKSENVSEANRTRRHQSERGGETRSAFRGLDLSLPSGTLDPSKLSRLSDSMSRGVYGVKTLSPPPANAEGSHLDGGGNEQMTEGEEIDVADLEDEALVDDGTSEEGFSPHKDSESILGVADQAEVEGMTDEELTLAGADVCEMGVTTLRTILASDENALYRPRSLRTKADVEALSWRQLRDAYAELSRRAQGNEESDIVQGKKKIVGDEEGEAEQGRTPGGPGSGGEDTRGKDKKKAAKQRWKGAEEAETSEVSEAPDKSLEASTWTFDSRSETEWAESPDAERLRKGRDVAAAARGCLQYVAAHLKRAASRDDASRSIAHLDDSASEFQGETDVETSVGAQAVSKVGTEDEDEATDLSPVSSSTPVSSLRPMPSAAAVTAPAVSAPSFSSRESSDLEKKASVVLSEEETFSTSPVSTQLSLSSSLASVSSSPSFLSFRGLGLSPSVAASASAFLGSSATPSPVQAAGIPRLLRFMNSPEEAPRGALVLGAQTGSGKTLAYLLPLVHQLKREEERETESRERTSRGSRGQNRSSGAAPAGNDACRSPSACASFVPGRGEEFDEEALSDDALRHFDQKEAGRPRALILTPTWELADQVARTLKALSASFPLTARTDETCRGSSETAFAGRVTHAQQMMAPRLSVLSLAGDGSLGHQRQQLRERTRLDVVVGTPPRILKLAEWGLLRLSDLRFLVIDEADAMLLSEGFDSEIRQVLANLSPTGRRFSEAEADTRRLQESPERRGSGDGKESLPRADGRQKGAVPDDRRAKGICRIPVIAAAATVSSRLGRALESLTGGPAELIEASGIHVPPESVRHEMIDVGGRDKLELLREILRSHEGIRAARKVLIFTNSVQACRACDFAARDTLARTPGGSGSVLSCHGSMPPAIRKAHFNRFANGACKFLVCTDLASRGLDLPAVGAVILFDFPLSPVAYLHRAGRTGRMGRKGLVVSLVTKKDQVLATAIQRALETGTANLAELSSNKADYQKGGRLHFLSQAGGYNTTERKLSEPYRVSSKTRRAGWKPPNTWRLGASPQRVGDPPENMASVASGVGKYDRLKAPVDTPVPLISFRTVC